MFVVFLKGSHQSDFPKKRTMKYWLPCLRLYFPRKIHHLIIFVDSRQYKIQDNVFKVMADSLKRSVLIPFLNAKGAQVKIHKN